MHRVFGIKENAPYEDREGAYLIPVEDNKIGVIKTPKGYFFLGGGLENNESHRACIERECLEEAGYKVIVKEKSAQRKHTASTRLSDTFILFRHIIRES